MKIAKRKETPHAALAECGEDVIVSTARPWIYFGNFRIMRAVMPNDDRTELLRKIKDEVLGLTSSPLYKDRVKNKTFPVIGEGSHYAGIMFIGEAPGKNEAATGRPFCGAAGKILDQLLESIAVPRQDVYITNIVKDRPPFNRDPLPEEIEIYAPFLDRQIDIIRPKTIVTLGRFSMDYIMRKFGLSSELKAISQMHGKIFEAETLFGKIKIIPLYHPAVAVYNSNMKTTLIDDFKILKRFAKQHGNSDGKPF